MVPGVAGSNPVCRPTFFKRKIKAGFNSVFAISQNRQSKTSLTEFVLKSCQVFITHFYVHMMFKYMYYLLVFDLWLYLDY